MGLVLAGCGGSSSGGDLEGAEQEAEAAVDTTTSTTTTTTTTTTTATTIDPVIQDQNAYFFLSVEYNSAQRELDDACDEWSCLPRLCDGLKKLTEDLIRGLEEHEWRDEVQDEIDEQIRLSVLELQPLNGCSLQEGTYSALDAI